MMFAIIRLLKTYYDHKIMAEGENNDEKDIHPKYTKVTVTCSTEIRSKAVQPPRKSRRYPANCHPFYTGKQFIAAAGRIDNSTNATTSKTLSENKDKRAILYGFFYRCFV